MTLPRLFTALPAILVLAASVGAQTSPPANNSPAGDSAELPPPRQAFAAAQADFATSNYPAAARAFLAAADSAAQSDPSLSPSVARYNAAVAADRAGDPALAASALATAADSAPDPALQAKAFYNRGIALLQLADQAAANPQTAPTVPPAPDAPSPAPSVSPSQYAVQAVDALSRAVLLDPDHLDAKINYEIALRKLDQYRQMEQSQPQPSENDPQDQQDDSQAQNTPDSQESQPSQESQESQQPQDDPAQQDSPQPQDSDSSENDATSQPTPSDSKDGEMTEEEARLLMDMMRDEEQALRERLQLRPSRPVPVEKDW